MNLISACRQIYRGRPAYRAKQAAKWARHRDRGYEYVQNYIATHPCADCGESDPVVLGFDYPGGEKNLNISYMVTKSYEIEDIQAEIDKSVIRCANCHIRNLRK